MISEEIEKLKKEVWETFEKIQDLSHLENFRVKYLGKKGKDILNRKKSFFPATILILENVFLTNFKF